MTTLLILAHYDDEYCALPLLMEARAKDEPLIFAFNAPPRSDRIRARRLHETVRCLDHFGLRQRIFLGDGADRAFDGQLIHRLDHAFASLLNQLDGVAVDGVITPAWEGGHVDHDMCAVLSVALADHLEGRTGVPCPVLQFSLYNGAGLVGPFFHGASPLARNGRTIAIRLKPRAWFAFACAVRFYPSQVRVWSTLWPATFLNYVRHGYRVQRLSKGEVSGRPHPGALLYERRGGPSYAMVAKAVSAFLHSAPEPQAGHRSNRNARDKGAE